MSLSLMARYTSFPTRPATEAWGAERASTLRFQSRCKPGQAAAAPSTQFAGGTSHGAERWTHGEVNGWRRSLHTPTVG